MIESENELDYHIYKQYQVLGLIGKGTYGQVYKVKHKKSEQIFAIKKICDVYQNITDAKRTYRQLNFLFQLSHPCIVKLYQVIPTNKKNIAGFNRQTNTSRTEFFKGMINQQTNGYSTQKVNDTNNLHNNKLNKHVYALFQFIETDLSKALRLCNMELIQRKYITFQLIHGLSYLHKSRLIHRDIKPSNILIDSNCDVKICDFGLCRLKQTQIQQNNQQNIITQYVASRWYRPPQILLGFSPCNQAIDIWGIGCIMAQLILRQALFQGGTTMDQLEKIFRLIGLPSEKDISQLQTEHAKFILRNFTFSRKNKPQKINQILSQASDEELDLIQKLLKFNPQQRLSAQQALKHSYFSQMKEMNYNFESYSFPVKIIDHTEPSTFLSSSKLNNPQQQKFKKISNDKNSKKKQITLEQYQSLIEQLQRATSRSSNRGNQQNIYKKSDKIVQTDLKNKGQIISQQYNNEKSTRESNFLNEHRKIQKQKKKQSLNSTILETYSHQKQYLSNTFHKNINIIKQNRNAYSTQDYYPNNNNQYQDNINVNYKINQIVKEDKERGYFKKQNNQINNEDNNFNLNVNYNYKNIEQNLQINYDKYFSSYQRQNFKTNVNNIMNNNKGTLQKQKNDKNFQKNKGNKTNLVSNSGNNNKSKSKIDQMKNNEKSLIMNGKSNNKISNHQNPKSLLEQNKNKYASVSSLNYQFHSFHNKDNNNKGKVSNSFKKKDHTEDYNKLKDTSKTKYISTQSGKSGNNNNKTVHLKSTQYLKSNENNSLNKLSNKRQRKKSKDTINLKSSDNSQKQMLFKTNQNCFNKIQIQSKKQKQKIITNLTNPLNKTIEQNQLNSNICYHTKANKEINKNSTKDLKKSTTLQKKSKKSGTSKSIGKKKSQTKINSSGITLK